MSLLYRVCFGLVVAWLCVAVPGVAVAQPTPAAAEEAEPDPKDQYPPYVREMMDEAEKGNRKAMYELGVSYCVGIGVPKNIQEALKLWRKAADGGNARSISMLGTLHYRGEGVEKNMTEAIRLWHKAAERYDTDAMSQLGFAYLVGDTVKKDPLMAYMWFNIAASNGDTLAAKSRDSVAKGLPAYRVAEAQQMGTQWLQQHAKPADNN